MQKENIPKFSARFLSCILNQKIGVTPPLNPERVKQRHNSITFFSP